jgi:hypothetical protein
MADQKDIIEFGETPPYLNLGGQIIAGGGIPPSLNIAGQLVTKGMVPQQLPQIPLNQISQPTQSANDNSSTTGTTSNNPINAESSIADKK